MKRWPLFPPPAPQSELGQAAGRWGGWGGGGGGLSRVDNRGLVFSRGRRAGLRSVNASFVLGANRAALYAPRGTAEARDGFNLPAPSGPARRISLPASPESSGTPPLYRN